jgi:uncharacterized repeat protein (TIGR03843 family)
MDDHAGRAGDGATPARRRPGDRQPSERQPSERRPAERRRGDEARERRRGDEAIGPGRVGDTEGQRRPGSRQAEQLDGSGRDAGPESAPGHGRGDGKGDGKGHPNLPIELDRPGALALLREGELDIEGRLVEASNLNLYCSIVRHCPDPEPDLVGTAVYKPIAGERRLDDFPDGTLAMREVAAYVVSEATGWGIVPPTILRDGPFGPGMVQLWIDIDESVEVIDLLRNDDPGLRRMAVFDAVVNNADRKGGHLLPVQGGHIFGVDHGICFSPEPKLRTILWAWRGQPFNDEELEVLRRLRVDLAGSLGTELGQLLAPDEVTATARRVNRLLARGVFPQPDPFRPAIPWPPF